MRFAILGLIGLSVFVSGCHRSPSAAVAGERNPGRYSGIGVYDAGPLWGQMARPAETGDPDLARTSDDEHVIVVIDSHTGEVRQCGDLSGYCVRMNPWLGNGPPPQSMPVRMREHAEDLQDVAVNASDETNGASSH